MIELRLTSEIIGKHKNMVFGKNVNDKRRLYKKLKDIADNEKQFVIKRVFKWVNDNLEYLVVGNLEILSLAINEYNKIVKPLTITEKKYIIDKFEIFLKEYIYFTKNKNWNAYKFQRELKVIICPYCNSQFTFLYQSKTGRSRATLDHFFDKDTYPFLAISIYNLVPSCKICNSDLKNKKSVTLDTHYSPFEEGIEKRLKIKREIVEASKIFSGSGKNSNDYVATILGVNEEFNIVFNYDTNEEYYGEKIKGNIELFHLDKIYNEFHKEYVQEIVKKTVIYNEVYLSQLTNSNSLIFREERHLHDSLFNEIADDKKKY